MNPRVTSSLQHTKWIRVIVKIKNPANSVPSPSDAPYAPGKKQALQTPGVRLVSDFDQLPALLVEIEDTTALAALAANDSVETIDIEATYRPLDVSPTG